MKKSPRNDSMLTKLCRRGKNIIPPVFLALWILFVLYPNPLMLGVSIVRIFRPEVNAAAVYPLLETAPLTAAELEAYVLEGIPYQYDWVTYGVPWYFPTAREALAKGRGDCKTRFVVLASFFEARGIPYRQNFSLSHFWLVYEGKDETPLEKETNSFLVKDKDGGFRFKLPREDLSQVRDTLREGFWDAMPVRKKIWLAAGLPLTFLLGFILRLKGRHYPSG